MRRSLLVFIVFFIPITILSQKTEVKIIRTKNASVSTWQVLDEKYFPVLISDDFPVDDSVFFSLESNKRYSLLISIDDIFYSDTCLYALWFNNEPIILINSDTGTGDHLFPFFTGERTETAAKITGGSNADISEFPWQVYLEAGNFTCGGSIISESWIITAAHCTMDDNNALIPASAMDVIVGANNPRNPLQGKKYEVSEVIRHESFNHETLDNDIALLKLRLPVDYPNAVPIKLVSAKDAAAGATDPGVLSWVTGYGVTSVNPTIYPSTLQKVQLPIVSNSVASTVWRSIPPTDMMAGYRNGNKDACIGDSGGPLVVAVEGKYKLAGLVSWGSSRCNTYGAYTRLSLFESWITENSGIEITFIAPVPKGDSIICIGTYSSRYQVSPVPGASEYKWSLQPANAGLISGNSETVDISWNSGFAGKAEVSLQVSRNDELSDMSSLMVTVAKLTRIIREPVDTVMCAERPIALKIEAEGYNLIYSWYRNRNLLQSGPSGVFGIQSSKVADSGQYYCEIDGFCGHITSGNSSLTVLPVTRINGISPDSEVSFGGNLALSVTAEGHNLTYQWQKDNISLDYGISSSLVLQNTNANDIGLYGATVTGSCGTESSKKVYVYVRKEDYSGDPEVFVWPTLIREELRIALSNDKSYTILLNNTVGKLLKKKENCRYETIMNISGLPPGIYIVTVYNESMRKSLRIIKK